MLNDKSLMVNVESLPTDELPVSITMPEFMRRMKDMSALSGEANMFGNMPGGYNVVINANHALAQKVLSLEGEAQQSLTKQLYDLALLAQNRLTGPSLTAFVKRTVAGL